MIGETTLVRSGCVLLLLARAGCTGIPRLDVNLDADPVGVPPSTPAPSPPDDQLNWRTGFVSSTVDAEAHHGYRAVHR